MTDGRVTVHAFAYRTVEYSCLRTTLFYKSIVLYWQDTPPSTSWLGKVRPLIVIPILCVYIPCSHSCIVQCQRRYMYPRFSRPSASLQFIFPPMSQGPPFQSIAPQSSQDGTPFMVSPQLTCEPLAISKHKRHCDK